MTTDAPIRYSAIGACLVASLALAVSASACGSGQAAPPPTVARTPVQAVSFYHRALVAHEYAAACRLLTAVGRVGALRDAREFGNPRKTCAAALAVVVGGSPPPRLADWRIVEVRIPRDMPPGHVEVGVRFSAHDRIDVEAVRQGDRWLLPVNPYSPNG